MNIPEYWCVKARNKKEEEIVNKYARKTGGGHWTDGNNYARSNYLHVIKNKYSSGRSSIENDFTEISFEDFKRYVLNEPEKSIELW